MFAVACVATALPAILRAPAEPDARERLLPALVIATGGAVVTFAAYLAFDIRCGHRCEGGGDEGFGGFHRWWHRDHSWQWSAQLTIAAAGLVFAALAFAMAARRRPSARAPLWAARVVYAAWVVLVFAVPAAYELVRG